MKGRGLKRRRRCRRRYPPHAASTDAPASAMAPRQDPIPDSYIRRCVTKEGKTRWNVRHYDPTTRRTVTLGTFAALAEAKAAYRARECGGAAGGGAVAAVAPGAKTARAPKPSAARAATAAPAQAPKTVAKKGEKRKRPPAKKASAAPEEDAPPPPPPRRRRRSSAETAATTAIVVASPSARMRNLADAALLAAKASVQKRLPPKKRGLAPRGENSSGDSADGTADASPVSGMTPRLASPRRRRGSLILAPSFRPPERRASAAQAICDAAAANVFTVSNDGDGVAAKPSSSSSSHGTRRRARTRRSLLGGIARRLSDGLLGVLSRAGRPAQPAGTGPMSRTLVPAEGPGWRWSTAAGDGGGGGGAGVVARKSTRGSPSATAEAVDVSVGDFRAAMAAAGVVVQHRVRLSLAAAAGEEDEV